MATIVQDNAGVVAPPPLIYAGGLALGLLLHRLLPIKLLTHAPRVLTLVLGSISSGLALTIAILSFRQMRNANTHIDPTQPTNTIVTSGPFRFTRNPIYTSLTLLYIGVALIVNSLLTMLLLPIILVLMNVGVIAREERYLERKFGTQYLAYKQRVHRWL